MRFARCLFALLGAGVVLAAPTSVTAQRSDDFFASEDNYWNGKRRDFPECAGLVDQHEALSRELYDLDAEARRAVVPRQGELVRELNAKARERTAVQRKLDACTREVLISRRPGSTTLRGMVSENEPELTLDKAHLDEVHQLSARIDAAARGLGAAASEFLGGVLDWAKATLDFLAQKPGEPLNQIAQGIVSYLTNDNAANHAMLRGQAEEAVRQFQQNPARFTGQLVPNLLPLPRAQALAQLARVEAAGSRALAVAANQQRFASAYNRILASAERRGPGAVGISTPGDACFAQNACFPTAMAQDLLWRSEQPYVIQGAQAVLTNDLRTTAEQAFAALRQHNAPGFAPRKPGLFTPPELDTIWQGIPLEADLDRMTGWLRANGEGSQAIVLAELTTSALTSFGRATIARRSAASRSL
jgi:hypothetical protein